ncbi:hypothetical protein ACWKSP_38440 [Micromonosporaceae bacterium Da 78-11]
MLQSGVAVRGVNVMTMDFNNGDTHPDMLALSTGALNGTHKQISGLYLQLGQKLTSPEVWSRIGATPMIGQNDIDTERFTLDDAKGLASFAVDNGLGRVSMWSLNRDASCRGTFANVVVHSNTCSGVDQDALAFSKVFAGLPGKAAGSDDHDSVDIPDQAATVWTTRRPACTRSGASPPCTWAVTRWSGTASSTRPSGPTPAWTRPRRRPPARRARGR